MTRRRGWEVILDTVRERVLGGVVPPAEPAEPAAIVDCGMPAAGHRPHGDTARPR